MTRYDKNPLTSDWSAGATSTSLEQLSQHPMTSVTLEISSLSGQTARINAATSSSMWELRQRAQKMLQVGQGVPCPLFEKLCALLLSLKHQPLSQIQGFAERCWRNLGPSCQHRQGWTGRWRRFNSQGTAGAHSSTSAMGCFPPFQTGHRAVQDIFVRQCLFHSDRCRTFLVAAVNAHCHSLFTPNLLGKHP